MSPTFIRPEDRQRSSGADWHDTVPSCQRSEAFAEDLGDDQGPPPPAAEAWPVTAALPLLGLVLAAVLGMLAR